MLSGTPFYNQTVRKSIAVFGTLFNNLYYTKPSKGKARVPISYGPAQKFISKINDAGADTDRIAIKLPRMSFEISSIDYDTARTLNKMNKLVYPVSADSPKRRNTLFQGVPYNLGITLTVIAKDQDSALQIVEQILPTFKPDYTVGIKDFHRPGMTMDVPIILNSVTLNDDYEGDYESSRVLTYTLEFTMKINFYGSVAKSAIIKTAEVYFHNSPEGAAVATHLSPFSGVKVSTDSPNSSPNNFIATTTFGFTGPKII